VPPPPPAEEEEPEQDVALDRTDRSGGSPDRPDSGALAADLAAEAREAVARARQRIEREAERSIQRDKRALIADLLGLADDLERALASAQGSDPALLEGVELVERAFLAKLRSHEVERFESRGEPFDPELHEAVSAAPVNDPREAGRVLRVLRPGYRIAGEVLRPAMVEVGRLLG
jgi:molecular chaperone GrpE